MSASDARPVPIKNTAFRLYFTIRDKNGAIITTWAGQDTELMKDGAAPVDATNEATETSSSGMGYIDLTSGEMNYDCIGVKVFISNTDAIIPVFWLYPREAADLEMRHADGVESGLTGHEALMLAAAGAGGKLSGAATTTVTIRNPGDTKNRIVATVDVDGNRSAVTRDLT